MKCVESWEKIYWGQREGFVLQPRIQLCQGHLCLSWTGYNSVFHKLGSWPWLWGDTIEERGAPLRLQTWIHCHPVSRDEEGALPLDTPFLNSSLSPLHITATGHAVSSHAPLQLLTAVSSDTLLSSSLGGCVCNFYNYRFHSCLPFVSSSIWEKKAYLGSESFMLHTFTGIVYFWFSIILRIS